ncbi:MAG: rhodanese-like domain-containing protein, partial [Dehalococcoidia bacterium]|nr:rhodanese-like domain-containing protein [Dehalococcoidia bacterium]
QTGQRSAVTYLTLRLLGYEKVRNYDGSWQEWGNETDTPIEK